VARYIHQVTYATCHSLDAGCCISRVGPRWVHPLYASCNLNPTASPSHSVASSSSSSSLSTSKSTTAPRAKRPVDPRRT
ncbi:hypothetical protein MUK42_08619, partial [Musa troglodytarum]